MSDLAKLVDELADLIADKVAARLSGTAAATGSIPAEADPPDVIDKDDSPATEEAPEEATDDKPVRRTRKSRKAESKTDSEPESEEDTDLPTPEQIALVKDDCDEYDLDAAKSELLDYYISRGHKKAEAAAQIAECSNEEVLEAFIDYSARLLSLKDDGGYDYSEDFEHYYKAERLIEGETVAVWVKYATTLTPEEAIEAGLADPDAEVEKEVEEKPAPKKRTRKAKA